MRDDKGRFTSPEENKLSEEMEELLGRYLHSLKSQKGSKKATTETRESGVRYWLAYCERNNITPLAAETPDVRGYL